MVRVGLAEPSDRDAGDVDAHRRLLRVARTLHRVRMQRAEDSTGYEDIPDHWAAR